MKDFNRFGVIGAGAWGTALAQTLARAGHDVLLWARETDVVEEVNAQHENVTYLKGVALDPKIKATTDLAALEPMDVWLWVVPVQHTRGVADDLRAACVGSARAQPIVLCNKGIEQKSLSFPESILAPLMPDHPLAVLSGPTFAAEVARGLPTAVTLACRDGAMAAALAEAIGSRSFRPYSTDDVTGAEVGGAIKNVIAVACGIATGCQLGDNARAALITRGLAEMMRLGMALGGRAETLMGLSGLGDLTLTCSSFQSRNMSLGAALGKGETLESILASRQTVAEGVPTAAAAVALAEKLGVEMPIASAVHAILYKGAGVEPTIEALLSRPRRPESP